MNNNIKNIYFNTIIGFVLKVILLISSFINRSVFIKLLGSEYLGISGLYSNIISILSLADLGIYTASMFSFYKPLSDKNYEKINSLIKYFSKIYKIIGFLVIVIGSCITPFLKYIITDVSLANTDLCLYYLLFVVNSGLSYFNVCKSMLLRADKKVYLVDIITSFCTIISYILQIVVLSIIKNYYAYILIQIFATILNNLLLTIITNRKYPYLKELKKTKPELLNEEKKTIVSHMKSVALVKFSGVIMNSTDNILISILLGSIIVGYYSNYNMIIMSLSTFIFIVINAIIPNIGEINARGNKEEIYNSFKITNFIFNILAIFVTATLICVFNDFIKLWIQDSEYVLPVVDVILISINFYITCITHPLWMFTESTGLFKEVRVVLVISAILNIILSLILGKIIGLGGIILATGISRLVTMYWYEPMILYKKIFDKKISSYLMKSMIYVIIASVTCICCYLICSQISTGIINFGIKILICLVFTIVITIITMFKTDEFNYVKKIFYKRVKK